MKRRSESCSSRWQSSAGYRGHLAVPLHLLFETIWKFRFFYRDINDLLTRNRLVETHSSQSIPEHKESTAINVCQGLAASGALTASSAEIRALATNMSVVATFWLSFEHARRPAGEPDIGRGIYQVMSLAAPYLQGETGTFWKTVGRICPEKLEERENGKKDLEEIPPLRTSIFAYGGAALKKNWAAPAPRRRRQIQTAECCL